MHKSKGDCDMIGCPICNKGFTDDWDEMYPPENSSNQPFSKSTQQILEEVILNLRREMDIIRIENEQLHEQIERLSKRNKGE